MNIQALIAIMKEKNISTYNLYKLSGVDSGNLNRIINKKVKNPKIDTLLKIANGLKLNSYEFAKVCGYIKAENEV